MKKILNMKDHLFIYKNLSLPLKILIIKVADYRKRKFLMIYLFLRKSEIHIFFFFLLTIQN
jgi:hypothetical protein